MSEEKKKSKAAPAEKSKAKKKPEAAAVDKQIQEVQPGQIQPKKRARSHSRNCAAIFPRSDRETN